MRVRSVATLARIEPHKAAGAREYLTVVVEHATLTSDVPVSRAPAADAVVNPRH